ncbi:hypothetical protein [Mesorhizobium jarvisii]
MGQQQSQAKSPKTAASDGGKAEIENDRAALLIGSIGAATRLAARRAQLQISCHSVGDLELALGANYPVCPSSLRSRLRPSQAASSWL